MDAALEEKEKYCKALKEEVEGLSEKLRQVDVRSLQSELQAKELERKDLQKKLTSSEEKRKRMEVSLKERDEAVAELKASVSQLSADVEEGKKKAAKEALAAKAAEMKALMVEEGIAFWKSGYQAGFKEGEDSGINLGWETFESLARQKYAITHPSADFDADILPSRPEFE